MGPLDSSFPRLASDRDSRHLIHVGCAPRKGVHDGRADVGLSVSPVAGGDFSVSQVLGDESGRGMSSGPGGSSRRRSTNEGQRGGEMFETKRRGNGQRRVDSHQAQGGVRDWTTGWESGGGDGGGGGPAGERQGEQGGLQFHVPIQSVPFPHGMVSASRDDCRLRSSLVVLGERWARGRAGEPMAVHAAEVWRRSGTRWSSPRIQEKPSPVSRHPAIQQ